MKRCAFLTIGDPTGFVIDDDLAREPLRELGWTVEAVPWRSSTTWDEFEAVVIRSPWDYQDDPAGFLAILGRIEGSGALLFNRLDLVRWNLEKTYLRDLAAGGVPIVPTIWRDRLDPGSLAALFDEVGTREIVLKPVIGANADGAYRLDRDSITTRSGEVESYYARRALMAQPMIGTILTEGEYSLFYFDGSYSHAIVKTPKAADFRVQEEHGGVIRPIRPDGDLLAAGAKVLETLSDHAEPPLYARVDLVRAAEAGPYLLMELELIEPALYFRMDAEAPGRFAKALDDRMSARSPRTGAAAVEKTL